MRFFSGLFNATFKTNKYLERGLITGITRVAKESIFTGMNNLNVITTTSNKYMTSFGFTEEEVFAALDNAGYRKQKEKVKRWYDGFTLGVCSDIYNPWSIVSFMNEGGKYDTYWSNTSGNGLVNLLIQQGNPSIKQIMEDLLQGKSFEAKIDEKIVFDQLNGSANAVWSLLLATGYLKVLNLRSLDEDKEGIGEEGDDDTPERFYHGFVLGLVVELAGRFEITSNRESGFGRYDIMLTPTNREKDYAYIIEFKVHKSSKEKDLAQTVANAHSQIDKKLYDAKLIADGFSSEQIRKYGFAFNGKECLIG
ncbi:hypothetical protein IMSAGC011_02257 [Lachnospiraceae bacterium]|nr:hypothetical protein IMSAGC011_02257 [Lachnospiraceae bacterium]